MQQAVALLGFYPCFLEIIPIPLLPVPTGVVVGSAEPAECSENPSFSPEHQSGK